MNIHWHLLHVLFSRNTILLQNRDNKVYAQMIKSVLDSDGFYFSYTYDLTHTLQRLQNTTSDFGNIPLFERVSSLYSFQI